MKEKVLRFLEALDENGEYYFSQGSIKKDYNYIKFVLESQGYWSGVGFRYYFDKDFNLIKAEGRF